ncbi:MAG TPA: saccharopine dehydrogenase NADP-binding domain-containing protein, partial [Acidimicrobiales bacterium]|nr:saccharopine dehydrogenase NADP-binding domain-containing protein [Acidimicrobiales bacterium]
MRVLLVGAGGVGSAFVKIAARRDFIESLVVADIDAGRASEVAAAFGPDAKGIALDASDAGAVEGVLRAEAS